MSKKILLFLILCFSFSNTFAETQIGYTGTKCQAIQSDDNSNNSIFFCIEYQWIGSGINLKTYNNLWELTNNIASIPDISNFYWAFTDYNLNVIKLSQNKNLVLVKWITAWLDISSHLYLFVNNTLVTTNMLKEYSGGYWMNNQYYYYDETNNNICIYSWSNPYTWSCINLINYTSSYPSNGSPWTTMISIDTDTNTHYFNHWYLKYWSLNSVIKISNTGSTNFFNVSQNFYRNINGYFDNLGINWIYINYDWETSMSGNYMTWWLALYTNNNNLITANLSWNPAYINNTNILDVYFNSWANHTYIKGNWYMYTDVATTFSNEIIYWSGWTGTGWTWTGSSNDENLTASGLLSFYNLDYHFWKAKINSWGLDYNCLLDSSGSITMSSYIEEPGSLTMTYNYDKQWLFWNFTILGVDFGKWFWDIINFLLNSIFWLIFYFISIIVKILMYPFLNSLVEFIPNNSYCYLWHNIYLYWKIPLSLFWTNTAWMTSFDFLFIMILCINVLYLTFKK